MPTYGQTIRWTGKDKSVTSVTIEGRAAMKGAIKDAVEAAANLGWTYPKWYEYWRKHDTRPDLSLIE